MILNFTFVVDRGFNLKLLNRAKNKCSFNITLHTNQLRCNGDTLLLFGDQTDSTKPDDGLINGHFDGYFKELEFVSEVVDGEMYQCKFRSTTPDPWPYIYVEVIDLPSGDVQICDIDFDI